MLNNHKTKSITILFPSADINTLWGILTSSEGWALWSLEEKNNFTNTHDKQVKELLLLKDLDGLLLIVNLSDFISLADFVK